jgi:hypothetical protein
LFNRGDHLFELVHDGFGHPDLTAFLADIGGDAFHHVEFALLIVFEVNLFQVQKPAAGLALAGIFIL